MFLPLTELPEIIVFLVVYFLKKYTSGKREMENNHFLK